MEAVVAGFGDRTPFDRDRLQVPGPKVFIGKLTACALISLHRGTLLLKGKGDLWRRIILKFGFLGAETMYEYIHV